MSEKIIAQSRVLKNKFYEQLTTVKPLITKLNNFLSVHSLESPLFITHNEMIEKSFDMHMELLMNVATVKPITELINRYYDWVKHNPEVSVKLSPRVFLSAWTIASFPEYVLDRKIEDITEADKYVFAVFNASVNFINVINDTIETPIPDNFIKLISCLNTYANTFNYFLQKDKILKIKDLASQWYELGKNIKLINNSDKYGNEDKKNCSFEIQKTRTTIEKHIKKIAPEFDLDELKKFETLADNTELTMLRAYRDVLYNDITAKKYDLVNKVMNEIKGAFIVLNKNLEGELNDFFDVAFLIQQHNNDILTLKNIYDLGNYLVSKIKTLESPAGEPETVRKWNNIVNINHSDIDKAIVDVFIFIMDEIDDIKQNIINLQTMVSLGINPFMK
jgi:hypothetical protein